MFSLLGTLYSHSSPGYSCLLKFSWDNTLSRKPSLFLICFRYSFCCMYMTSGCSGHSSVSTHPPSQFQTMNSLRTRAVASLNPCVWVQVWVKG